MCAFFINFVAQCITLTISSWVAGLKKFTGVFISSKNTTSCKSDCQALLVTGQSEGKA